MKILVISLAGIGDTLFATPLIHELRANFPDAGVDALVMWAGARDALEGNPHLNRVYQKNLIKAPKGETLRFLYGLRRQRYDVSINTHPQSKTEYRCVARFINARLRISHQYDNVSLWDRLLVNLTVPQDYGRHSIENNLACLACLGVKPCLARHDYEIYLSEAEACWAEDYLRTQRLTQCRLMGVHIGSGGTKNLPLRRWPVDAYAEVIRRVHREHPEVEVLLFGGPEEEKDNARLLAAVASPRLRQAETRSLRQAAALICRCQVFLSVDTALMHLAAAMKVPGQIVIETPTWNKPIEPYKQDFILVTNPAVAGRNLEYYRYDGRGIRGTSQQLIECMAAVTVDKVCHAVETALARPTSASSALTESVAQNPKGRREDGRA